MRTFLGAFLLSVSMVAASSVLADDGKDLPGISCEFSDQTSLLGPAVFNTGVIANPTTASLGVNCPLVRDIGGAAIEQLDVLVTNPTNLVIDCRLHIRDMTGVLTSIPNEATVNVRGNIKMLQWFAGAATQSVPAGAASLSVACSLPPGAGILRTSLLENQ